MSGLADTCRRQGMSPETVQALALILLEAADELRAGPGYEHDRIGPTVLERVMAAGGVA